MPHRNDFGGPSRRTVLCCGWALAAVVPAHAVDSEARQRDAMVTLIESRGIRTPEVLAAMREVPRHLFVPEAQRHLAYEDESILTGRSIMILQPYTVALMTDLLKLRKTDRVLEIGTGTGYQTAILSKLSAWVFSIDASTELLRMARGRLDNLGCRNTTLQQRDVLSGWPEHEPYDRILLTGGPAELPDMIVRQLAPGGRLVAPLGPEARQELMAIQKERNGKLTWTSAGPVSVRPLR